MIRVYDCLVRDHDLWLVAAAAVICLLGSFSTFSLINHRHQTVGRARLLWLGGAAIASGFAIWATHFVAMLSFQPTSQTAYDTTPTLASLAVAILVTGAGIALSGIRTRDRTTARWVHAAGGLIIGVAIGIMHYVGMSGFRVAGTLTWDVDLVVASILIGGLLGAAALAVGADTDKRSRLGIATGLLVLAICGLHFTGMGAVTVVGDPRMSVPANSLPPQWLAVGVALGCMTILMLTLASVHLDLLRRRRVAEEAQRMRDLADAAVEGLVVIDGDRIVAANKSFESMLGKSEHEVLALLVSDLLSAEALTAIAVNPGVGVEADMRRGPGPKDLVPVELVSRPIIFGGQPRQVVAIRDLRARRRAEAEIRFLAYHDPLTGLLNRASFNARLDRQFDEADVGRPFAVLALDLDRFKGVNDTLGHPSGDILLQRVADRLRAAVRTGDVVARLGGDEFAILLTTGEQPSAAIALAHRLVEQIALPFQINGQLVNIGTSVGIAIGPADGSDATELLKNADLALYRAKSDGRGAWRFFEPEMDLQMQARRSLELDLHAALARQEFEMHYQPLFDVRQNTIAGFEALVRWRQPERGLVSPADFIPLAEETGLIIPLGEWVLNTACSEATRWPGQMSVAVNLSPAQFQSKRLVDMVEHALRRSGLAPHLLELEITETVLLQDSADTLNTLHRLRALGIRISMDDFGTGYSSLSYLRSFPFDKIKIDRSFINEVESNTECAAIVRAIVGLGHSLGIATTAEGVETAAQMDHMRAEGCDQIQGYLISRPVPAHDLTALLNRLSSAAA
ncbi:bifunctional diguanylate cyclase/phosphodiesterase [Zavarzinia sp. CC-PAN008]|uniref:bifunctional diguanylate cyclase/phosphodiesterase n=1 Tax=Zavarzinia sp. CC-PAN008 TaxID=3243332 RepID=UPI003F7489E8